MLIGRKQELAGARDLLRCSSLGRGGALLFSGEAGIGKTAMLDVLVEDAEALGFVSRRVTGVPSESNLPYAALHSLVRQDLRVGRIGPVLESAVGLREAEHPPLPPAVGAALLSHLSTVAQGVPLLVVIDDLQWIDPSSAEVLLLCAQRLLADRVAMIFARRTGDLTPDGFSDGGEGFSATIALRSIDHSVIGPLSVAEGIEVLVGLGVSRPMASELADLAAGSPLALGELARSALGGDRRRKVVNIPVNYSARIAELSADARDLCTLISLEDDHDAVRAILGAVYESSAGEAVAAGILSRQHDLLRFSHPLFRAAALADRTPADLRRAHLLLAHRLDSLTQHDRIAIHRSHAAMGVDDEVAELMDGLARSSERRGALEEAARAMHRAAELSSKQQDRIRRLLQTAELRYYSGDTQRSSELAARVAGLTTDPVMGCQAELMVAKSTEWSSDAAATVSDLMRLSAELADSHPLSASQALAQASAMAFLAGSLQQGIENGRHAIELAKRGGDELAAFVAQAHVGWNLFLAGRTVEANEHLDIVEPVMRILAGDEASVDGLLVAQRLSMRLLMKEEWAEAEALVARSLQASRRLGLRLSVALFGAVQGVLAWRRGRWDEAWALATLDLDVNRVPAVSFAWLSAVAGQIAATMGNEREAQPLIDGALAASVRLHLPLVAAWAYAAQGHLELSKGNPANALPSFDRLVHNVTQMGLREPGFFLWHGDYLEALVYSGELAEAGTALAELRALAEETGRGWALGVASRVAALLTEDPRVADDEFRRAEVIFESLGMPFEIARTRLCRGRANQTLNPESARLDVRAAESTFLTLGADLWARQAGELADGLGAEAVVKAFGQERLLRGLSRAETAVALCARSGSTNREIAAELYVSVRTVEFHLRSIYRKVGVRNRAELIARFASN